MAATLLVTMLGYTRLGWGCSLSFTSPLRGSTLTSANVAVSGTGSGTANSGDVGTVTATINGQVFFSQSGTFTRLIQFLGSGAASVTLKPGINVLQVAGQAGACSASDSMVVYYTPPPPVAQKAAGAPLVCNGTNPIDGGNGNKFQAERDYTGAGPFPLVFERYYNSLFDAQRALGPRWQHSYDRRIAASGSTAYVLRPDGRALRFAASGAQWLPDADVVERLARLTDGSGHPTGWRFNGADDTVELFDDSGRLTSITRRGGLTQRLTYDGLGRLASVAEVPFGRRLVFSYDASNRLSSVTDPAGGLTRFAYDGAGRLASVTYPDGTPGDSSDDPKRQYRYEDARFPQALTGLIDENGVRYASWAYDGSGRAIRSEHAGGVERFTLAYNADGSATVTDPLGTARTYRHQMLLGVPRVTGLSQPCSVGCSAQTANTAYDEYGNVISRTDFNGVTTTYAHDAARHLELSRTAAAGTPQQRTIATEWHAQFRVPTRVIDAKQTVSFTYDAAGRVLTRTVTAGSSSRVWRFSYSPEGLLTQVNGPRTNVPDVTTLAYYPVDAACPNGHPTGCRGLIKSVRNAKGHVTTFSAYDAHGRVGRIVDPNGAVATFTYDTRGRLTQNTVDGAATRYAYDRVGQLLRATAPTGAYLEWSYDPARRVTGIADRAGNRIRYTLDAAGHPLQEDVYDPGNVRVRTQQWAFDHLSRLAASIGASEQSTTYRYDAGSQLTGILDPADQAWSRAYDPLHRLITATDPSGGITRYQYDALDRLLKVTDAEGLSTAYAYNGFGDLLQRISPDTGRTRYTYDTAGNATSRTDADGVTARYAYDALNRLVAIDYPGTEADVAYAWDGGTKQKGFLTQAKRGPYSVELGWTTRGQLVSVQHAKNGVATPGGPVRYAYSLADQLVSIRFGESREVRYVYGADGAVSRVQVVEHTTPGNAAGDSVRTVASGIVHLPFGPVKSLTYGNGLKLQRSFDLDYRLTQQTVGTQLKLAYAYDSLGNLTQLTNQLAPASTQRFAYDPLDRLTDATGWFGTAHYSYDAIGNRLGEVLNGQSTSYAYGPDSHQLLSANGDSIKAFSYSPAGNTLTGGNLSFSYSVDGRLAQARRGAQTLATYGYDAFGQRVEKITAGSPVRFEYDQQGRLLRETGRDYVYLEGELLALLDGTNLNFVHGNHLGAPVSVTNQAKQPVWRAAYQPFGAAKLTNPALRLNVRLPGQYLDAETGLHYNYFRDYDPTLGRYLQSDPIGLAGGMSTYAYGGNNPIQNTDTSGLIVDTLADAGFILYDLYRLAADGACGRDANLVALGFDLVGAVAPGVTGLGAAARAGRRVSNPVPSKVARVIPEGIPAMTLGRPGTADVFVTASEDIAGMNAAQIAERLTIPHSPAGFQVIEFPTPRSGIASPVFRTDPGFVGGGRTMGGAREFAIPNGLIPENSAIRTVR